ncbi:Imm47 family immunity protein [Paenibacillaceae sp. P-4]|uniref:Imm47 family immunity protein n=1 Tax=Paenibacillaceae bacterium P-4 TaxID=3160969 RepID=UPI0032E84071
MNINQELSFSQVLFGRPIPDMSKSKIWSLFHSSSNEVNKLLYLIDLLKLGDFSAKKELSTIMLETSQSEVRKLSCQIFCCVAQHSDINILTDYLGTLFEYEDEDEFDDELQDFVLFSIYTLSPSIVPILLDLLDEWEGEVESSIKMSLDFLYPGFSSFSDEIPLEETREYYMEKSSESESGSYIFGGMPVFPGDLSKKMLERAAIARYHGEVLQQTHIPTLLSLWSGIDSPAYFFSKIDDDMMGKLFSYVNEIAYMKWEKGCKYFFGWKV